MIEVVELGRGIKMDLQDIVLVSPNMINVFEQCPLKFYYKYKEDLSAPVLEDNFQVGKTVHALASYYLKGYNISKLEGVLNPKESELWSRLKKSVYFSYEIVGVEKSISVKLEDFWFGGRIDSIVKNGDDYYILDYKTGSVDEDMIYNPQTMVYLLMVDEMIKDYDLLTFVYIDLKNNKEVKIKFNEELKKEYQDRLIEVSEKIHHFNKKNYSFKGNCKCEYSNLCKREFY